MSQYADCLRWGRSRSRAFVVQRSTRFPARLLPPPEKRGLVHEGRQLDYWTWLTALSLLSGNRGSALDGRIEYPINQVATVGLSQYLNPVDQWLYYALPTALMARHVPQTRTPWRHPAQDTGTAPAPAPHCLDNHCWRLAPGDGPVTQEPGRPAAPVSALA